MGHIELASGNGSMEIAGRSALGRTGTPEEVASVIVFLCSKAASFVTGVDLLVDGGAVASLLS